MEGVRIQTPYRRQPAVPLKKAYAIAQHSHQLSSRATAGWGGQEGQAAFGVPFCTAPGQAAPRTAPAGSERVQVG